MKQTPCGHMYITIARKDKGRVHFIQIFGKTENECGNSWRDAVGNLLTFAIRRATTIEDKEAIIDCCRSQRCNKVIVNKEHIESCADALSRVLREELLNKEASSVS
jgi:hypothetical protein